jgi:hypothetical protein
LQDRIRAAGEKRGFAVARLLTHWEELVGSATARIARPVKVSYGREGFGATLTLLVSGSSAPLIQMELPTIRERVNACYGYNAISHIRITQTAPEGFAEGQASFVPDQVPVHPNALATGQRAAASAGALASGVNDPALRAALERLGTNVLTRHDKPKG